MRSPLETKIIPQQDFAAPDGPVRPKPEPIQNDPRDLAPIQRPQVFAHTRREVGVVMLHFLQDQSLGLGPRGSVSRGAEIGVQVHCHDLWFVIKERCIIAVCLLERLPR